MKKKYSYHTRKHIALCTAIALPLLSVLSPVERVPGHPFAEGQTVQAKAKIRLNKTSLKLKVGASSKLHMIGTKKKVSWKSSKKSVATVSAKGKVTAKKVGKAKITAKVAGKKYVCKVNVSKKSSKVTTGSQSQSSQVNQVVSIINQKRKSKGIKSVKTDAKLQKAAMKRAKEIAKKFDHTRPNGSSCFTILEEYDINYRTCGENIAYGQPDAKSVMDAWMHSPGHRSNILNSSFGRVGIGLYKKSGTCYWVQIFAN